MHILPRRQTLVSQTVAVLKARLTQGEWRDWLPSERALCGMLQISRNTLRGALLQLKRDGLIEPRHGAGNAVLNSSASRRRAGRLRSRDVACLIPAPLEQLRPAQALWIDELRAMLSERDCRLHVFHGRQYFRANPAAALSRLVSQNPHGCWVLALSGASCQQWFQKQGLPCVIAGSCHPGVDLPFRDLDHRAMCRHAAGVLLAQGNRRVALLMPRSGLAGDLESEAGFLEGVQRSPHAGAQAIVSRHDATVASITLTVKRLLASQPPVTAMVVANPYHYLTVTTGLAQLGHKVPGEVALISRDEDPFLSFLVPRPACYLASPQALARSLLRPVLELLEGGAVTQPAVRLMPEFLRGETLGGAPARAD